jgi:4-diphosphocytidyl-2-C-methyl-D-erythritol kinase
MVSFPNAKINLGLYITEKRSDGFHNIESCFYPVDWSDVLEIIPASATMFNSSGISIPGDINTNLCLKVYESLKKDFPELPSVHIHLLKNIPIGAGMGGGSSDAAFTGHLLNDIFNLGLTDAQLEDYVRPLGSDCAFFIKNVPVVAFEKGDRFRPTPLTLKGKTIRIIYPNLHISTKEAYSGVVPGKPQHPIDETLTKDIREWRHFLKNDFEDSLFPKYPVLQEIKEGLYEQGALYASMTGSGSAVYGIFDTLPSFTKQTGYSYWEGTLK